MKKKKLFLLASLAAALAMSSCSSFDEPAAPDGDGETLSRSGARDASVYTEAQLRDALDFGLTEITIGDNISLSDSLKLDYAVTINGTSGKKLTTTAPIVCTANATFNNLTIDATTGRGVGAISMNEEDITVVLDGVTLTQNTTGTSDSEATIGVAIQNRVCNNSLKIHNSNISLPGNYVRGVNMRPMESNNQWVNIEVINSTITCGTVANLGFPSTYSRCLSFTHVKCDNAKIDHSTLQGAYYVVNVNGDSEVTANVINNSVLDGRAGFNVWSTGFVGNVTNSTIIGHNNYAGPTESFANIVICSTAENCTLNLTDATFKMDVVEKEQTNSQYAVSFRASDQTLNLAGYLKIFTTPGNYVGSSFFSANQGVGNIRIDQTKLTSFDVTTVLPANIYN